MRDYQKEAGRIAIRQSSRENETDNHPLKTELDKSRAKGSAPGITLQPKLSAERVLHRCGGNISTSGSTVSHSALQQLQRIHGNQYISRILQASEREDGKSSVSQDIERTIESTRGGGQALDSGVKNTMGEALGADFSGVRVHTDLQADGLNHSLQARAFTTGQDVYFRQGEYNPGSSSGRELLAHELTHVVQQGGRSSAQRGSVQQKEGVSLEDVVGPVGDRYAQHAASVGERAVCRESGEALLDGFARSSSRGGGKRVVQRDSPDDENLRAEMEELVIELDEVQAALQGLEGDYIRYVEPQVAVGRGRANELVETCVEGVNNMNQWLENEHVSMLTQFYGDHANTTIFAGISTAVGFTPMPYGAILGFAVSEVSGVVTTEMQNVVVDEAIERTDFLGAESRGRQTDLIRQIFRENNNVLEELGYKHGLVAAMFKGEPSHQIDDQIEDIQDAIRAAQDEQASSIDLDNGRNQLRQSRELVSQYDCRKADFLASVSHIRALVGRSATVAHSALERLKQAYLLWLLDSGELQMRFCARRRQGQPDYTFTQVFTGWVGTGVGRAGGSPSDQMRAYISGKTWDQMRDLQIPLRLRGDFYSAPNQLTFSQSANGERSVSPRGMIRPQLQRAFGSYDAGIQRFWTALSHTPIGQQCML